MPSIPSVKPPKSQVLGTYGTVSDETLDAWGIAWVHKHPEFRAAEKASHEAFSVVSQDEEWDADPAKHVLAKVAAFERMHATALALEETGRRLLDRFWASLGRARVGTASLTGVSAIQHAVSSVEPGAPDEPS
jgi:hypothetical protein